MEDNIKELEIQERVKFKLNDIRDNIKNNISRNKALSFIVLNDSPANSQRHFYYKEAYQEFSTIFEKEILMGTPVNEMLKHKQEKLKNKTIDEIMVVFDNMFRRKMGGQERNYFLRKIVDIVEKNQI